MILTIFQFCLYGIELIIYQYTVFKMQEQQTTVKIAYKLNKYSKLHD